MARRIKVDGVDLAILSFPASVPLTDAEHAIGGALLAGMKNGEIARERGTTLRTVANQVASLYRKLGVQSRSEFVAHAALFGGAQQDR